MMIRRLAIAAVLVLAMIASACSGASHLPGESSGNDVVNKPGSPGIAVPAASPEPAGSKQVAVPDDLPAATGTCGPMPDSNAYGYLEELSRLWGEYREGLAAGEAREVFLRQAAALYANWPAAGERWATEAWSNLEIQRPEDGILYLVLHHSDGRETNVTRFFLACYPDGNWRFAKIGHEQGWYVPAPVMLEGQATGDNLTEDLAKRIVKFASDRYGSYAMNAAATGREWARGRMLAISEAAGAPVEYPELITTGRLKLEPRSANEVVGTWVTEQGESMGQQVLFKYVGQEWKMADHTENGQWAPERPSGYTGPPAFKFDRHLLGISLGMTEKEVRALIMEEPQVKGSVHTYPVRKFSVEYDAKGRVNRVSASSGVTARGVHAGFSEAAIMAFYGEPASRAPGELIYTDGLRQLRLKMSTWDGVQQLSGVVLEYQR